MLFSRIAAATLAMFAAHAASASLIDIVGDHPDRMLFECKKSQSNTLDLAVLMTELPSGKVDLKIDYRSRDGKIQRATIEHAVKTPTKKMQYVFRGDPALQARPASEQYELLFQLDAAFQIRAVRLSPVEANLEGSAGFDCEI